MDRRNTNLDHCGALDCTEDARNTLFCRKHWQLLEAVRRPLVRRFADLSRQVKRDNGRWTGASEERIECISLMVSELAYIEGKKFYNLPEVDKVTGEELRAAE